MGIVCSGVVMVRVMLVVVIIAVMVVIVALVVKVMVVVVVMVVFVMLVIVIAMVLRVCNFSPVSILWLLHTSLIEGISWLPLVLKCF